MIIRPTDVHENYDVALAGVSAAARALGIEFNCSLMSLWLIKIDGDERASFLELAREEGLKAFGRDK